MDNLIVVKTFLHRHEAEIAKGLLESGGIKAIVSADNVGGFRPHLTYSTGNVRLLINENDLNEAKDILKAIEEQ